MSRDTALSIAAELRAELAALYGERLAEVVLYGSHARAEAAPAADIDVMVVLRGTVRIGEEVARTAEIAARLSLCHDTVVSCAFVEASRYGRGDGPLLRNVRREGVPICAGGGAS